MLTSALKDDSTHQWNITKENMEEIVREKMRQKVNGLWFPPMFITMITFVLAMLVLLIVMNIFKKCFVRKAKLKRLKKPKDPDKIKRIGKSLAEILDELEANEKGENEDKYGRISFQCNYDFKKEEFTITIISAEDLLSPPGVVAVNSYAVVYFLPLGKPKFETCIKKKTINPSWEDTFIFSKLPYMVLLEQTLMLEVRHDVNVKFGKNPLLGVLHTPMRTIDIKAEKQLWYTMTSPGIDKNPESVGQINISIRYIPTASRLMVSVVEIKNLMRMDPGGLADPYVKLVLYHGNKILSKSKTSIKKATLNPYFDESFEMVLPYKLVENVELNISVFDKDMFRKEFIGFVKIGCSCQYTGRTHWVEILDYPRKDVVYWHELKTKQKQIIS